MFRVRHASAAGLALLSLLAGACASGAPAAGGGTAPQARVPSLGAGTQATTVKVLSSLPPETIVQFPLQPVSIKPLYGDATGLVTVLTNPSAPETDTLTVDVQRMPANTKFTVFLVEHSLKPFGHAEYVGDLITRADGSGESVFHTLVLVAFAADNRNPGVASADQLGQASGIQLEHLGMWFDGVDAARQVLKDPTVAGTPFDGGGGPLHAGPQAMTDGQTLPVV